MLATVAVASGRVHLHLLLMLLARGRRWLHRVQASLGVYFTVPGDELLGALNRARLLTGLEARRTTATASVALKCLTYLQRRRPERMVPVLSFSG